MPIRTRNDITAETARRLVSYDPETGVFRRLVALDVRFPKGTVLCAKSGNGYIRISVQGKMYLAHRLAWLLVRGEWPEEEIDHIDGNGENNRWDNLRKATRAQQTHNCRMKSTNRSGFKGVSWDERNRKWRAYIKAFGCSRHLGYFSHKEHAAAAYQRAALELHGRFAFTNRCSQSVSPRQVLADKIRGVANRDECHQVNLPSSSVKHRSVPCSLNRVTEMMK